MPKPYSVDLRERVMDACRHSSVQEVAKNFKIGVRTIYDWQKLKGETGDLVPQPWGGGRPSKISDAQHAAMLAEVDKKPDITLEELQTSLALPISVPAICMRLLAEGYTLKKRRSMRPSATVPTPSKGGGNLKGKSRMSRRKT